MDKGDCKGDVRQPNEVLESLLKRTPIQGNDIYL